MTKRVLAILLLFSLGCSAQQLGPAFVNRVATTLFSATNAQASTTSWQTPCTGSSCAGGSGTATNIALTAPVSTPSLSGSAMELSFTATAGGTNVLAPYKPASCDNCTWIKYAFSMYAPSTNSGVVSNYEMDGFVFDLTDNLDLMWGLQCNTTNGQWQIANQTSSWVNTGVTCSIPLGQWQSFIVSDYYVKGDTSCSGMPCLHFGSITQNGTTYWLNQTMVSNTMPVGWGSASGFQIQMDVNTVSGSPVQAIEYIDNATFTEGD